MTSPTPAQKRKILAEEYDPAPTLPPTPARIEAAIKAIQKLWVHPTHAWQFELLAEAALTAAAQVEEPPDDSMEGAIKRGQQQAIAEEATQAGEAPTDKMMIEHLNDQIQTLLCENEQLKAATQVGEQEITGLKAMLVDAGAKIERMKEMLSASERLRDHAERELGKESELVKQLRKDVEINATIEHCAQVAEGFQNKWYDGKEIAAAIRKLKDGV